MFQYINNDMHRADLLDLHDAPKHTNLALKKIWAITGFEGLPPSWATKPQVGSGYTLEGSSFL